MESNYAKLGLVLSVNAVVMFLLTYVNLAAADHFHANLNRMYMAIVMVAPMGIAMLVVMRSMYEDRRLNLALYAGFGGLFLLALFAIRTQTPIGNEQFLRSMIPHHSSAILMCEQSAITDPEIRSLCEEIVRTQIEEIARMERILERH